MANYFRLDTSFMKEAENGRLYSGLTKAEIPNGVIYYLGGYENGSTEVRELLEPTADLLKSGKTPVIVAKPEINYDESKMADYAIGIFRNPAGKPVPVIPFSRFDGIDLSEDYFDMADKATFTTKGFEEGDIITIQENAVAGTQLKYVATAPTSAEAKMYFRVIGVKNSHKATYVTSDGTRFPKAYKMVQLEAVFND